VIANLAADVHAFTSNVFLVDGERPVLVDPGANFDVVDALADHPDPEAVVLTHAHPDHVGNLDAVREAFEVPVYGPGAPAENRLSDGDTVQMGDHEYRVLETPGHHPEHVCLYAADAGVLFAGDLVFQNGGFGRTDLEGADHAALVASIEYVLEECGDLAALYAGHGPVVDQQAREHVELALRAARTSA
jgi:hydroxyacylglutathione hydrolase